MNQPPTGSDDFRARNPHLFPTHQSTSRAVEVESDLHDQIEKFCNSRGYLCLHSRMDMMSTIAVGWPDFTIFMPGCRVVFVECKSSTGKATTDQLAKIAHARKLGFPAEIIDNYDDFLVLVNGVLKQGDDLYMELLFAVASKFDGETRHQTALRFIREREEVIIRSSNKT